MVKLEPCESTHHGLEESEDVRCWMQVRRTSVCDIRLETGKVVALALYGARAPGGRMFFLLLNKHTSAHVPWIGAFL